MSSAGSSSSESSTEPPSKRSSSAQWLWKPKRRPAAFTRRAASAIVATAPAPSASVARRLDPAENEPVGAERRELRRELAKIRLDRVQPSMPPRDFEPELVEPRTHFGCLEAVQVEELDAVVPDLRDCAERSFEVAGALVTERVQHESDLRHAIAGFRLAMKSRYQ